MNTHTSNSTGTKRAVQNQDSRGGVHRGGSQPNHGEVTEPIASVGDIVSLAGTQNPPEEVQKQAQQTIAITIVAQCLVRSTSD